MSTNTVKVRGINLLPQQYIQEQNVRHHQLIGLSILCLETLIFVGAIAIPPQFTIMKQNERLNELNYVISDTKFNEVNEAMSTLSNLEKEVELWREKHKSLKQGEFVNRQTLDKITSRVPSDMSINSLTFNEDNEGRKIVIEGKADDGSSVLSYIAIIEALYGTNNVTFDTGFDFSQESVGYAISISIPQEETVEIEEVAGTEEVANIQETAPANEISSEDGGLDL